LKTSSWSFWQFSGGMKCTESYKPEIGVYHRL